MTYYAIYVSDYSLSVDVFEEKDITKYLEEHTDRPIQFVDRVPKRNGEILLIKGCCVLPVAKTCITKWVIE